MQDGHVGRKGWGTHSVVGMNVRVGSLETHPLRQQAAGHVGRTCGPQRMGHPQCGGDECEGWKFGNPPFAAASSRACTTDMWAAKDGAPTFCVRDECEGRRFVNPPFAAASSRA